MRRAAALALVALLTAACGATAATFTPTGACLADGKAPGTYPDLESLLPAGLGEEGATTRDSGRNCSDTALGTLKAHGVTELRFAGATWSADGGPATVVAVFRSAGGLPALQSGWVEEFYQAGAHNSTKTENITIARPTISNVPVWRLDTLNNLSFQSVVVWRGEGVVHVVIVATEVGPDASKEADETAVRIAVLSAAGAPSSSPG